MAKPWAKAFYKSKSWQNARLYVLKRDIYLCRFCDAPAKEVHHIIHLTPQNIFNPDISLNEKNLISLCTNCHLRLHEKEKLLGIKANKKTNDCDEEYYFNENGELVKKLSPL